MNIYLILIIILIILNIFSIIIGIIFGRLWSISGVNIDKPKSFLRQDYKPSSSISIDDKVYVTDINTNDMIKKYDDLGKITQSNENISSSVNKLKQMKG